MNDTIQLEIIKEERKLFFKVVQYVFIISLITSFLGISLADSNLLNFFSISLTFLSLLFISLSKEHNTKGFLTLANDYISVSINSEEMKYLITNVSSIKINYKEYLGENYKYNLLALTTKKGLNNYIEFIEGTNIHKYEIKLQNYDLLPLNRILNQWREKGIIIILINKWGNKTESITF